MDQNQPRQPTDVGSWTLWRKPLFPERSIEWVMEAKNVSGCYIFEAIWFTKMCENMLTVRLLQPGHLDKVDQSDFRITTVHSHSKKGGCWPISSSQENNKLLEAQKLINVLQESKMFFYLKLGIQHPGDRYFFDTSCYFVIYQQFLHSCCGALQ